SRIFGNAAEVEVERPALEQGAATGNVVLTAGGYIVAHHPIDVSSKVVGKVAWVGIEKGDQVREDQVIVRLEDAEFVAQLKQAQANVAVLKARLRELETGSRPQEIDAAKAAMDQAQANFHNADITLKRTKEMFRQEISSQSQLEGARKNYELVKIGPRIEEIEYAQAQVAQAQAAVEYAQTMLDSTLIRAPVTGTVLERLVEKGEMVSTMNFGGTSGVKASVASVADLNDLQAQLDINQNDFSRISPAQPCSV